jgi:hypothetical protein
MTRLPRQAPGETALNTWITGVEERQARGEPAMAPGERVLVISEDPGERARLSALARRAGLKRADVGPAAIVLQP